MLLGQTYFMFQLTKFSILLPRSCDGAARGVGRWSMTRLESNRSASQTSLVSYTNTTNFLGAQQQAPQYPGRCRTALCRIFERTTQMGGTWSSVSHPQQYFCSVVDPNLASPYVITILLDPVTSPAEESPRTASTCQISERALYGPGQIQKATHFFKRVMTPVAASSVQLFIEVQTVYIDALKKIMQYKVKKNYGEYSLKIHWARL